MVRMVACIVLYIALGLGRMSGSSMKLVPSAANTAKRMDDGSKGDDATYGTNLSAWAALLALSCLLTPTFIPQRLLNPTLGALSSWSPVWDMT